MIRRNRPPRLPICAMAVLGVYALSGCSNEPHTPDSLTISIAPPAGEWPSFADWACSGQEPYPPNDSRDQRSRIQNAARRLIEVMGEQGATTAASAVNEEQVTIVFDQTKDGGVDGVHSVVVQGSNGNAFGISADPYSNYTPTQVTCAQGDPRNPTEVLLQFKEVMLHTTHG